MFALPIIQDCCTIQLDRGFNTLVDVGDWIEFKGSRWVTSKTQGPTYAVRGTSRNGKDVMLRLSREILDDEIGGIPAGMLCDHKNLDSLDNRRANLRAATRGKNKANSRKYMKRAGSTSRFKGVYRSQRKKTAGWCALIAKDNRNHYLGTFDDEIAAARAYNKAARELYGEFACLNEDI